MEAERHRFGGKRIGRIAAGAERLGALEKVNHDFGIGVAEGWRSRLEELLRALVDPGETFLAIACAESAKSSRKRRSKAFWIRDIDYKLFYHGGTEGTEKGRQPNTKYQESPLRVEGL